MISICCHCQCIKHIWTISKKFSNVSSLCSDNTLNLRRSTVEQIQKKTVPASKTKGKCAGNTPKTLIFDDIILGYLVGIPNDQHYKFQKIENDLYVHLQPLRCYIFSQGYSFSFFLIFAHLWWFVVLGLGFSVDGIWGLWCGAFWVFLGWDSLCKHKRITLGKNGALFQIACLQTVSIFSRALKWHRLPISVLIFV